MDNSAFERRLTVLRRGTLQDQSFFETTYGIGPEQFNSITANIKMWATRQKARLDPPGPGFSRWIFESYCSSLGLLPPLQAAAQIGMDVSSLLKVVEWAQGIGLPNEVIRTSNGLFLESFLKSIHENFPVLRNMTFSDQTRYLRRIHAALREEGVEINQAHDPVASILSPTDIDLSYYVDIITLKPIGLRFTVWMSFGKPITLTPDMISLRTYIEHEAILRGFLPEYYRVEDDKLEMLRAALRAKNYE